MCASWSAVRVCVRVYVCIWEYRYLRTSDVDNRQPAPYNEEMKRRKRYSAEDEKKKKNNKNTQQQQYLSARMPPMILSKLLF